MDEHGDFVGECYFYERDGIGLATGQFRITGGDQCEHDLCGFVFCFGRSIVCGQQLF
jgi:hypothetical protein